MVTSVSVKAINAHLVGRGNALSKNRSKNINVDSQEAVESAS